jgi:hypothetical protein
MSVVAADNGVRACKGWVVSASWDCMKVCRHLLCISQNVGCRALQLHQTRTRSQRATLTVDGHADVPCHVSCTVSRLTGPNPTSKTVCEASVLQPRLCKLLLAEYTSQ